MSSRAPGLGVLIVDDSAAFRAAAGAVLAMSGEFVVVGEAVSGEDAVEQVTRLAPDLVLMDVRLPGIDGVEATRRVIAAAPSVAVVLVSTLQRHELPPGADTCGAAGYLRKDDVDADAVLALLD